AGGTTPTQPATSRSRRTVRALSAQVPAPHLTVGVSLVTSLRPLRCRLPQVLTRSRLATRATPTSPQHQLPPCCRSSPRQLRPHSTYRPPRFFSVRRPRW